MITTPFVFGWLSDGIHESWHSWAISPSPINLFINFFFVFLLSYLLWFFFACTAQINFAIFGWVLSYYDISILCGACMCVYLFSITDKVRWFVPVKSTAKIHLPSPPPPPLSLSLSLSSFPSVTKYQEQMRVWTASSSSTLGGMFGLLFFLSFSSCFLLLIISSLSLAYFIDKEQLFSQWMWWAMPYLQRPPAKTKCLCCWRNAGCFPFIDRASDRHWWTLC